MIHRILAVSLVAFLAAAFTLAQNPDRAAAPAGKWKVTLVVAGEENQPSWIVHFEKKGAAWTGSVVAAAEGVQAAKVEAVQLDGMTLSFALKMKNFTLPIQVKLPTEKEPRMVGTATVRDKKNPIVLEATKLTALDDFARAEEVLARPENTRATYKAALTLIALAGERRAKPEMVKGWAERAARAAREMGKDQCEALLGLAAFLAEQENNAALAIPYATRAEALVTPQDPPVVRKRILRVLATALERSGKEQEAKAVRARNDKIELIRLRPHMGKGTTTVPATVLVETFSCAQQAKCVGPDLACAALPKTYTGDVRVFVLNHHLSVPGPDPLANPAAEERERYYRPRGTPALYLNGKPGPAGGGSIDDAQARYDADVAAINPLVEKAGPHPTLTLKATRKVDFIEVAASVRDLAMPGEDVRLRLVLVEDVVAYTGANGLPRHTSVVRDYLGTAAGLALPEKSYSRTVNVDVGELRRHLRLYLEKANETTPFPSKIWPTELKKLRVVGFVQNDKTRAVLVAAEVEIKGGE